MHQQRPDLFAWLDRVPCGLDLPDRSLGQLFANRHLMKGMSDFTALNVGCCGGPPMPNWAMLGCAASMQHAASKQSSLDVPMAVSDA